jgi:hypothetical protein
VLSYFFSYAKCAGLFVILPMAWNTVMSSRLPCAYSPEVFSSNIPGGLFKTENTLRILVVALPFFAPLELISFAQKIGVVTFSFGLIIYLISWLPLIIAPNSRWSRSAVGFLAPAYTPIIWLIGLAMLMQRLHWYRPTVGGSTSCCPLVLWPPTSLMQSSSSAGFRMPIVARCTSAF